MEITYDYYRIFYYVATYQSFSKAAKILMSNQPNITRFINNLENQLGCNLFVRSNRGVQLTQEGRKLYQHVSVAYQHLHMAEVELMNEQRMDQGYITISASEIALHLLLLPVLEKFHKNYPGIRIRLLNHSTPQAVQAVKEGAVDLAVVTTPLTVKKPLRSAVLMEFREILVGSQATVQNTKIKRLEDIRNEPLICLGRKSTTYSFYSKFFLEHDVVLEPDIEVETMDLILPLILNGLGIGFLPDLYVKDLLKSNQIQEIRMEEKIPAREICLVENHNFPPGVAAETLKRMLLKENGII